MSILITGGAGFIGSNFVLDWAAQSDELVINLDNLTYAGNIVNLQSLNGNHRHVFVQGDIGDSALVANLLAKHRPRAIINFAAESHVDRSIHGPEDFVQTNIVGTFRLLVRAIPEAFVERRRTAIMKVMQRTLCKAKRSPKAAGEPLPATVCDGLKLQHNRIRH